MPVNASTGGSASVPVTVAGLSAASVTADVRAPHSASSTSATASGLVVTFTLRATIPVVGTDVDVPLGTVTLAHSECTAPGAATPGGGPTSTPPGGNPTGGPTEGGTPTGGTSTGGTPATSVEGSENALPAPSIVAVVPDQGPTGGGQRVTVSGADFVPGATVTFGGVPATSVVVESATAITATTPAHDAGPVDVAVTQGDSTGALPHGYTYVPPGAPIIVSINPSEGPTSGGQTVTIVAAGLTPDSTVTFGGVPATQVQVLSADVMTAVTPAHVAGRVEVQLGNSHGQSGTRPYTYVDTGAPCPAGASNASAMRYTGLGLGAAAVLGLALFGAVRGAPLLRSRRHPA